ncbi:hypothetical protein TRFO_42581 [Tritrichomonas foetus]|uniref:Uncharacterized protein n=1 Tax=Tritrichomonas foetus TaxID=1144522 RepID=A0A1J4KWT4_9EUKA|nr:hypothetical protein TRFO_42581 [Tritrichomonas foetus]|eukprot:OHT15336.1 hypothetical protein TRFO_42581 [Tritrichomonas foetus]
MTKIFWLITFKILNMNAEQKHELMFIMAKYLKTIFPDVAEMFVQRCEEENLFPKPVFSSNASFQQLQSHFLSGVPDDQLIRIISNTRDQSQYSSLLATTSNTLPVVNICDILTHKIGSPFPQFHKFSAHHRVIGHTNKIYCLAVDVTSQILITGSDDNTIKLWKIPELILMKTFDVNEDSISDLAIHPSNLYFGASSHDSTITIYSLESGRIMRRIKMKDLVHNLKFSPCGTFFGAACEEGCVTIWSFDEILRKTSNDLTPVKIINSPHKRPAAWLNFSPGGDFVVFSADPNTILVSSLYEDCTYELKGHNELPDFVFFSKITCKRILSLSLRDREIRVWEAKNSAWEESTSLSTQRKIRMWRVVFNSDESRIIGVASTAILVWDTFSKRLIHSLSFNEFTDHATIVVAHPINPAVVFVATSKGRSALVDIFNGQLISGLQSEEGPEYNEAIWSPDGQFVFASDSDGGATIFMSSFDSISASYRANTNIPYTEMFFLFELAHGESKFSEDNEEDTLICDRIGNPLLPQPQRWFLSDLRLKVKQHVVDQNEVEMLNIMKAVISQRKRNNEEEEEDSSENEYDREALREQMSAERDERLKRRQRMLESESDSMVERVRSSRQPKKATRNQKTNVSRKTNTTNNTRKTSKTKSKNSRIKRADNFYSESSSNENYDDYDNSNGFSNRKSEDENDDDNEYEYYDLENDEYEESPKKIQKKPPIQKKRKMYTSSSNTSSSSDNESDIGSSSLSENESENDSSSSTLSQQVIKPQLPEWTFSVKRAVHTYIPQIGEDVIYLRRGHEEWHKECNFMRFKTPYQVKRDLPQIAEAHISDIHFYITHLVITLKFNDFTSKIAYPVPDSPPFLIRKSRFEHSMEHLSKLKPKDIVRVDFATQEGIIKPFYCQIKTIAPKWKTDPYSCLSIIFQDDHNPGTIQPWEIIFNEPLTETESKLNHLMDLMAPFLSELLQKKVNQPFISIRSPEIQTTLRSQAKLPIDLSLINDRLINHWYTNLESLIHDVKILKMNILVIRRLDGELADVIVKSLMEKITQLSSTLKIDEEESEEFTSDEEEENDEMSNDNENIEDDESDIGSDVEMSFSEDSD